VRLRRRAAALRALGWALHAAVVARRRVAAGELPPFDLPAPPPVPLSAGGGVRIALRPGRFTCLVRATVLQAWYAGHGIHRDLIIGVTSPRDFTAHAWLDGDPHAGEGYAELMRRSA